jgi:hypothetical protein
VLSVDFELHLHLVPLLIDLTLRCGKLDSAQDYYLMALEADPNNAGMSFDIFSFKFYCDLVFSLWFFYIISFELISSLLDFLWHASG